MPDSLSSFEMTSRHVASFLGGLLFTSIIYGVLLYIVVMGTFSLSGERLTEKENREAFFFYTAVSVTVITICVIYRLYKKGQKYSAVGISIPLLFALYICLQTGLVYAENLSYHQAFQKTIWTQSELKPFRMAKTLVKSNMLIGKSRQQIIDQLGKGEEVEETGQNNNREFFKFLTDDDTWNMYLYFKNDKVVDAYLYQEGM
jgi:Ca2+/Na+ antiporter